MQNLESYKQRSISRTLSVGIIITLVFVAGLSLGVNFILSSRKAKAELETKVEEYISALTDALEVPLWNLDLNTIEAICASYAQNEFVAKLLLEDAEGSVYFNKDKVGQQLIVSRSRDLFYKDDHIGRVHIALASGYYTAVNRQLFQSFSLTIVIMIGALLVMMGVLLRQFLKKPMSQFVKMVNAYADGCYDFKPPKVRFSEFQKVVVVLSEMGKKIISQITELREAEEKYRGIFEKATEGIFQTTEGGQVLTVNPAMAQIFGYDSPEDFIKNVTNLGRQLYVEPSKRDELRNLLKENGFVRDFEFKAYRKDGTIIDVSENAHAVKDNDQTILYFEGTLNDITQKNRIGEELRRHREHLEELVEERTKKLEQVNAELESANVELVKNIDELERFTRQVVDREKRMIGLKEEINGLLNDMGHPSKYKIAQ